MSSFVCDGVVSSRLNGHLLGRSLIYGLHLLNHLNGSHAVDDSSEDDILAVHEAKRSTGSDVELAFVSVGVASSLAHAHKTLFSVLHLERLVGKLTVID